MKRYWPYIIILIAAIVYLDLTSRKIKVLDQQLQESQFKVIAANERIKLLTNKMTIDSIEYEKDKQHIKALRDRYPDDDLLDSLVRAGQSID